MISDLYTKVSSNFLVEPLNFQIPANYLATYLATTKSMLQVLKDKRKELVFLIDQYLFYHIKKNNLLTNICSIKPLLVQIKFILPRKQSLKVIANTIENILLK